MEIELTRYHFESETQPKIKQQVYYFVWFTKRFEAV